MDEVIFRGTVIGLCSSGFVLNTGVLIWKLCKRKWNRINSFFSVNLAVTNLLSSVFLLILSLDAIIDTVHGEKNRLNLSETHLCKIANFIQNFSYEAKVGFLFLKCCDILKTVNNTYTIRGLGVNKVLIFGTLIWFLSTALAIVPVVVLPILDGTSEREETVQQLCTHVENLHSKSASWEYTFGLHIGLNGLIYLSCIGMVITTIVLKKHSSFRQLSDKDKTEGLFLLQISILCFVDFICWVPSLLLGVHVLLAHLSNAVFLSYSHLKWITLLTTSIHTTLNPIIILATAPFGFPGLSPTNSIRSSSSEYSESVDAGVKLSKYLETGGTLSPQEAVVMTASLSRSLGKLYMLGLTTSIDPNNIYMEHDEFGTVVNSHLVGVPKKPSAQTLHEQIQADNAKIADLFESMMRRFNNMGRRTPNMSIKSRTSIKMEKSLSVKEARGIRRVQSRLRTRSERNFKSTYFKSTMAQGGVDDLVNKFDTLKRHEKFSLKYHRTLSLSIISENSNGSTILVQSDGSNPETPEDKHVSVQSGASNPVRSDVVGSDDVWDNGKDTNLLVSNNQEVTIRSNSNKTGEKY